VWWVLVMNAGLPPRPGVSAGAPAVRLFLAMALLSLMLLRPIAPATAQELDGADSDVPPAAMNVAVDEVPPAPRVTHLDRGPDYAIPGGWFYTEALGGEGDGLGFSVVDGPGARLATAYRDLGGAAELGYPISQRFDWDDDVAQAFQFGIIRWRGALASAELRQQDELPDGVLPEEAVTPQRPPIADAELIAKPWSGWWWPAFGGAGPTLYTPGSPLDKYDHVVEAVTGINPHTRDWERSHNYFPSALWSGHCNGFAAAALIEPEPTQGHAWADTAFSVADQKALLVAYHYADSAAWTFGENGSVAPADFQRALLYWLGLRGQGFVLTYDMGGGELWSYPVYKFDAAWGPDPVVPDRWHVTARIWMADMDVAPDFVGMKPYPASEGKLFTYTLDGDPLDPDGGSWEGPSASGRFAHPGRIWYPDQDHRNLDQEWTSPALDYDTIEKILGRDEQL
jgi:hypothetical protein